MKKGIPAIPTLCDQAAITLPKDFVLDGKSCASSLLGDSGAKPHREWIFHQFHTMRVVRGTRFKLSSDGRFFDANADPEEKNDLGTPTEPEAREAREKLQESLDSPPTDSPPPFPLRSQAMFKLRAEERAAKKP